MAGSVHELKSFDNATFASGVEQAKEPEIRSTAERDAQILARLGKKQVLKRNFGFMSMVSFSCTVLATWEGVFVLFASGFLNGGPAGLVYGYFVIWAGTLSTFAAIAELASLAPTAGGQYHWVYLLSPKSCRTFVSYAIGWSTVTAWQASLASGGYLVGTMIQGLIVLNHPEYVMKRWQGTLLFWATILFALCINILISSWLPKIEGVLLLLHVLGFAAILVVLAEMAPHSSASAVFSTFLNEGDWQTQGLSFMVGLIGLAFSFTGADAAVHMSEEIERPSTNIPKSIMTSIIINGFMGFGVLMVTLLGLGDLTAALTTATGYPFLEIFAQATQSISGSTAMASLIVLLSFGSTIGFIATSSRMIWSFARDRGLPFSDLLSKVNRHSSIPLYSVLVTTIVALLLALINIGSTSVFQDVISLSIAGFYTTYFVSLALLLWRRCTGGIKIPSSSNETTEFDNNGESEGGYQLYWGPWHLPGALGIINNILACMYLLVIWFFSFWPSSRPATASNMNYSVLVYGAVMIFGMIYYLLWGKTLYKGPRIEVEAVASLAG